MSHNLKTLAIAGNRQTHSPHTLVFVQIIWVTICSWHERAGGRSGGCGACGTGRELSCILVGMAQASSRQRMRGTAAADDDNGDKLTRRIRNLRAEPGLKAAKNNKDVGVCSKSS